MTLIELSYSGNYDRVNALLEENPDCIKEVDEFGHSALFGAVISKSLQICALLISRGANVNEKSQEFGFTVLHKACLSGSLDICKLLINNGADVHMKDQKDSDALYNAITGAGDLIMCQYLVENGASCDGALHLACFNGKIEIVRWLLDEYATINSPSQKEQLGGLQGINSKGYRNNTSLHLACQQGHYELCKLLIQRGADVRSVNEAGCTPLHEAVLAEKASLITALLIKHGADINAKDAEDRAPLHKASSMGHIDHCKALIDIGANINILDQSKCQSEHMSNKSPLKGSLGIGDSALHYAIIAGNMEMCAYLLDRGIDTAIKSATGKPIVHFACHHKKYKICALLVQRGADVDALDYKQVQIPTCAPQRRPSFSPQTKSRKSAVVHMLSLTYSETALQAAAQSGNTEACRVLLDSKADVSRADEIFGNTALHLACFEGYHDIVALLLQGGVEVNTPNKYFDMEAELNREDTALHIAAAQGHLDICMLLLDAKADFSALNRLGQDCIAAADPEIRRQLQQYINTIYPESGRTLSKPSHHSPTIESVKLTFISTLPVFSGNERVWKHRKVRFSIRKSIFKQTVWDTEIMEIHSAPGCGACISTIYSSSKRPIVIPLQHILPADADVSYSTGYEDLRLIFQEENSPLPFLKLGFGKDRARRKVWKAALVKHIENGR